MAHSIGYFTSCPQAEALTLLFGDRDLARLPQIDRAALLAILGQFVYQCEAFGSTARLSDAAADAIHSDDDETTDAIKPALTVLQNLSKEDAIGIIAFLVQQ